MSNIDEQLMAASWRQARREEEEPEQDESNLRQAKRMAFNIARQQAVKAGAQQIAKVAAKAAVRRAIIVSLMWIGGIIAGNILFISVVMLVIIVVVIVLDFMNILPILELYEDVSNYLGGFY